MSNAVDLRPKYNELFKTIEQIDEQLDSAGDTRSAGKRATVNGFVNDTEDTWRPFGEDIIENLNKVAAEDANALVGVYNGLVRMLNAAFDEQVKEIVENIVKNIPESEITKLSPEQLAELSKTRSELYKQAKMMRELASMFGDDPETYPLPKKRTGSRGPRGPRAISLFDWSINGTPLVGEENSLAAIAKAHGYEKVADFRKDLAAANNLESLKEPGDSLSFTFKDGTLLTGVARPEEEDDENGDDDE